MCCIIETTDDSSPPVRVVDRRRSRPSVSTVPRPPSIIYAGAPPSRHSYHHPSSSSRTSYTTVTRTHSRTRSQTLVPAERTSMVEYIDPGTYERRRRERDYCYERGRYGRGSGEVRILRVG